ncbi:MAG: hypothetical protein JW741_10745, partial [Sedimentisphaerales bacterium]|nr:hypothetical protein [Sedimentisphaerales bacterium]
HLATIGRTPADWGKDFIVMANIDLTGYDETNFDLIGNFVGAGHPENEPYTGTFDGNGKTISNFSYREVGENYVGLFRYVQVRGIKNLRLRNARVAGTGLGVGALVGYLDGGSVNDCEITGANVSGNTRVGGLIGRVDGGIGQCSSRGHVSGVQYVGGLIGYVEKATVAQCYSKATVQGDEQVGGFVGAIAHEYGVVNSCYATGNVDGNKYVGGMAGSVINGRLYKSYCTGVVTGSERVGGLTGGTWALGQVITSFWDVETSRQAESGGGTGKTTVEMYRGATYFDEGGWDVSFWFICEGMNYPVFRWQVPVGDYACPDGVELIDFALFALEWRRRNCNLVDFCNGADLDESGDVGFPDLAILAENWLVGTD